jgi:hypothetical protein
LNLDLKCDVTLIDVETNTLDINVKDKNEYLADADIGTISLALTPLVGYYDKDVEVRGNLVDSDNNFAGLSINLFW